MTYNDIFSTDPTNLSMGMPTVDPNAVITAVGNNQTTTGISPQTATGVTVPTPTPVGTGVGGVAAPTTPGFFAQGGIGQFALGAIQTLGSLWNSYQQQKLAKQAFQFQKEAFNTNLQNQEQSYNTALEDRIRSRYVNEGRSQAEADAYLKEHSL